MSPAYLWLCVLLLCGLVWAGLYWLATFSPVAAALCVGLLLRGMWCVCRDVRRGA